MENIIETHAHIYDDAFKNDLPNILQNAKNMGIVEIWMPNCNSETLIPMIQVANEYPLYCLPMVGLHPCYVKEDFETELQIIETSISKLKPLAIGEIGLDLFWEKQYIEQQKLAFNYQCQLALKHKLWIDIHSRNAFWETVEIIEKIADKRLKGIFHCFVGSELEANKAIELGFLLGIGGVATFKNGGIDKWLQNVDISNIVLETDSPYLAPNPYRGKRNEPAYLDFIIKKLSEIYQKSINEICKITTENALKLKKEFAIET